MTVCSIYGKMCNYELCFRLHQRVTGALIMVKLTVAAAIFQIKLHIYIYLDLRRHFGLNFIANQKYQSLDID